MRSVYRKTAQLNSIEVKLKLKELMASYFDYVIKWVLNEQMAKFDLELMNELVTWEMQIGGRRNKSLDNSRFEERLSLALDQCRKDALRYREIDPVEPCLTEVVYGYQGFEAVSFYRLAHLLTQFNLNILPRMISLEVFKKTSIDIHPKAVVGHSLVIDHGFGVVIGETATIGNRVTIYHGVTIGALDPVNCIDGTKRHPTIESDVIIYANSMILGGQTRIKKNSVVEGGVILIGKNKTNKLRKVRV